MDPLLLIAVQAGGLLVIVVSLRRPRTTTVHAARTGIRGLRRASLTVLASLGFATAAALASTPAHADDDPGPPSPEEAAEDSEARRDRPEQARFDRLLRDLTDEHYGNYPDEDPRPDRPKEFQGPGWNSHKIEVTKNLGPRIDEEHEQRPHRHHSPPDPSEDKSTDPPAEGSHTDELHNNLGPRVDEGAANADQDTNQRQRELPETK